MKKSIFTKLLSVVLACLLMVSMVPLTALANEGTPEEDVETPVAPDQEGTQEEEVDIRLNAKDVYSAEELESALSSDAVSIRIMADFAVDRTFYVINDVVLFSDEAHTLTRDPAFGGDMFVIGEHSDGVVCEAPVTLTVGDPESEVGDMLTIDGNKDQMTATVNGTVFFVVGGAKAELYGNLTVKNHKKTANEKTLTEAYGVSYPGRVGGAVAIIAKDAAMDIFGGTYTNNVTNDITDADTEEGQVSSYGGAFYDFGLMNVYGGVFSNNHAGRGGAFYCYRTIRIYNAQILNNSASTLGGAIYMPNSTSAYLFLGGENGHTDSWVVFRGNVAESNGGAIYARNKMEAQDTQFIENTSNTGSGGAVAAGAMVLSFTNTLFDGNAAAKYGGAIYYSGTNGKDDVPELTCTDIVFKNNRVSASGGALYMSVEASAFMENAEFTENTAANNGGAIYLNNAGVDIDGGTFSKNSCSVNGGAITATEGASVRLNRITASENRGKNGGFVYGEVSASLYIYDSILQQNTATTNGGAVALYTSAYGGIYNTTFHKNTSVNNGGALFVYTDGYTAENKLVLHSCTYTENQGVQGGAIYASQRSVIDLFNSTAKNNHADKGGFLYHTTTNTIINLAGLVLEGNTAVTGGPIIWGNSKGAVLNLDKALYIDRDVTGVLDDAYWAAAIYNSLKVNIVVIDIPNYIGYTGEEVVPQLPRIPVDIKSAAELEKALADGKDLLRIADNFAIDRTFYIYRNTTIYAPQAYTLTRAPEFGGDVFVVGESADGTLCENKVTLTLGDPESKEKNLLTIDGNKDNMTVEVVGSVIFVTPGAHAELYENVTIKNHQKLGNQKTLTGNYGVSYTDRVGGAVAILSNKSSMDIYGGTYADNAVTDTADATSSQGGAIYNYGVLNIYGGHFEGNYAARGGAIYGYRTTNIYNATFKGNSAATLGGVIYEPDSTAAFLNIGLENDLVESAVTFTQNTAGTNGGAIYTGSTMMVKNTTFDGNTGNSGAAIVAYGAVVDIRDSVFTGNTADGHGGAIYFSGHNDRNKDIDLTLTACTFEKNTATSNGGAVYFHGGAAGHIVGTTFTENSAANGGAVYSTGSQVTADGATFTRNTTTSGGGAVALYTSSTGVVNKSTFTGNRSGTGGGALYAKASSLTIYRSRVEENAAGGNGGGVYMDSGASGAIYATDLLKNTAEANGGGMFLYTNLGEVLVQECTFTENEGVYGGAIYASNKALVTIYDITATNNASTKGGFLYETTTDTEITLVGATVSGNTATDGGPIIWGNSKGAVLHIDKSKFTDKNNAVNSAYWSTAIVNSLTVKEITKEIPKWLDYLEESYEHMADAVDVSSAEQLEAAIVSGAPHIRVIADFTIDRTFHITGKTTIFSTLPRTLTRASDFGGDIFVVGETKDGKNALLLGDNAKLVLGNPLSVKENLLTIDGNEQNMTVPVKGSVLFICYSGLVDLYTNVTVQNNFKSDNERTYKEAYILSRPNRIGGTLAVVSGGSLNIYGGTYQNNRINDEDVSSEETRNSTIGGLIHNNGNVYIHGGTFRNNMAARGGIIYNYKTLYIYGGSFLDNVATVNGGAIYTPNAAASHTYIGTADENGAKVLFQNNRSERSHGGAIYSSPLCALVIYGNTTFEGNTADSSGGAICSYGQLTARNVSFIGNVAKSYGGAVYAANANDSYITRIQNFEGCTFENNTATQGGALALYSSNSEYANGAVATLTDCTFTDNVAASIVSKSAKSNGGAMFVERRSSLMMKNTKFTGNTARTEGGAIYAGGASSITATSTEFKENGILDNGKHGGAVSIHSVTLTLDSADFVSNTAVANGGALYVSYASAFDRNSEVSLRDVSFRQNLAEGLGGAIYTTKQTVTEEKTVLTAGDTEFIGNSATQGGAVSMVSGALAYMTDSTFTQNSATDGVGGAVYIAAGSLELDTATFADNTATESGGGIYQSSQATVTLYKVTATANSTTASGGFLYAKDSTLTVYDSEIGSNTAEGNGGGMALYGGATANVYGTAFTGNTSVQNGGGLFLYTDLAPCVFHGCTFTQNSGVYGGAVYASNKSVASFYHTTAVQNTATRGGFFYETTTGTDITLAGTTVKDNTATDRGPIIWGNSTGAVLHLDKAQFTDENHVGTPDSNYWASAIVNNLTVETVSVAIPDAAAYPSKRTDDTTTAPTYKEVSVKDVFNLANNPTSDADIDKTFATLPRLDNSSNFMSQGVSTYENINGGTVTVDSFIYPYKGTADNCNVGMGLLIYQAMCYKQAHPQEDVYIDVSSYRFSVQAAVNINRDSRYFGYMRNLQGTANYDQYGFVRIAYLLVSAAKMGIHVTAIGHIDAYPITAGTRNLNEYFTYYLDHPCDSNYVSDSKVGDYLNFCQVDWTLQNKGGTDMMHTKMCAVSHYLDMNGVAHRNAVFSSSSNLDGIAKATNGNSKMQTGSIVSDHEAIYRAAANYLRLIPQYQGQEEIYEFQNLINRRSTEQAQMILAGKESEIPAQEQIIYLGRDTDTVFEMYFTPLGGDILTWDEVNNPYCKYLRKLYNSEDYIIFTWNAAEYNGHFTLGQQMEEMLIAAFHENRNVNNKIYGNMENFDVTAFDDLQVGVDIGVKNLNQWELGQVHNKDVQFSYVENGQRYYVSLLNSMNMHSGSMYFQSNFALVIKETELTEDSVFFTLADHSTTGVVEHDWSDELMEYVPETMEDGYFYYPCNKCSDKNIVDVLHRSGEWIVDRAAQPGENGVAHRACLACGKTLEVQHLGLVTHETELFTGNDSAWTYTAKDIHQVALADAPHTIEALVQVDPTQADRAGVIFGNYTGLGDELNVEVYTVGRIRLFYRNNGVSANCIFGTDIRSTEPRHIAVTLDGNTASLYVDGMWKETKTVSVPLPELSGMYRIGGDFRSGNTQFFRGKLYTVSAFADVRSALEILRDRIGVFDGDDALLLNQRCVGEQSKVADTVQPLGKTFNAKSYETTNALSATPHTVEAVIHVPKDMDERVGVITGNYVGDQSVQFNLEVYTGGQIRVYTNNGGRGYTYLFDADIRSDVPRHIAVTFEGTKASLYIDGAFSQSIKLRNALPEIRGRYRIGGDNRPGNTQFFKGTIYDLHLFGDCRTQEQIQQDMVWVTDTEETLLSAHSFVITSEQTMIGSSEGIAFQATDNKALPTLSAVPHTLEATVQLSPTISKRGGVILGNFIKGGKNLLNLEIYTEGRVRLYYVDAEGTAYDCLFRKDIRSDKPVHLAVTVDGMLATLYVDGNKAETRKLPLALAQAMENLRIGGDNRPNNTCYFLGKIYNVALFSDARTADEVLVDKTAVDGNAESLLYTESFRTQAVYPDPVIKTTKALTFNGTDNYHTGTLSTAPHTVSAVVQLDTDNRQGGVIFGGEVSVEVNAQGQVCLTQNGTAFCTFDADIRSAQAVHLTVTVDDTQAVLYVNGKAVQTAEGIFTLGGTDGFFLGKRNAVDTEVFSGKLFLSALYSNVRTPEQIAQDLIAADITDTNALYMTAFTAQPCGGGNHQLGEWTTDAAMDGTLSGIAHKDCLTCGKTVIMRQQKQVAEVLDSFDPDKTVGFTPADQTNGFAIGGALSASPVTFEATIQLSPNLADRGGVIIGNYNGGDNQVNMEIYTVGRPRLYFRSGGTSYTYMFKTDVRSNEKTHVAITVDGLTATLYVNGVKKESLTMVVPLPQTTENFHVGTDARAGAPQYFKGTIYDVALLSDSRTAQQVAVDRYLATGSTVIYSARFADGNP